MYPARTEKANDRVINVDFNIFGSLRFLRKRNITKGIHNMECPIFPYSIHTMEYEENENIKAEKIELLTLKRSSLANRKVNIAVKTG